MEVRVCAKGDQSELFSREICIESASCANAATVLTFADESRAPVSAWFENNKAVGPPRDE